MVKDVDDYYKIPEFVIDLNKQEYKGDMGLQDYCLDWVSYDTILLDMIDLEEGFKKVGQFLTATNSDIKAWRKGQVKMIGPRVKDYKVGDEKVHALKGVSIDFRESEFVSILGQSGCGKTTLVSMIPRLYDVDEGKVLVDGIDVRDYSLNHLREGVGMVLQKNVLFSGTIEENLQWGDENAGKDQIRKAAESAQAEGFIQKLADGYDTELGQGGVNVSGGQKQRLCIARALLKRPKILILDDSTSAVDTATEAKIREAFSTTLKETTKLIIAQRIGSVMEADQIVVMDEGKIVGLGKHEALLETCKAYQEIYDSQMKKEVIA
mgnify:CR=1 FL=1